jgi:hypothetical protein
MGRILGAYYLGCPMADAMKWAYLDAHKMESLTLQEQVKYAVQKVR